LGIGQFIRIMSPGKIAAGNFQEQRPQNDQCQQEDQEPGAEAGGAIGFESSPGALAGAEVQPRFFGRSRRF
jgi:hypothetical protein